MLADTARRNRDLGYAGGVLALYGLFTLWMAVGDPTWDSVAMEWVRHSCPTWLAEASTYVVMLGQGGPLTAIVFAIAVVGGFRTRTWRPVAIWLSAFVLLFVVVALPKLLLRRGAPRDPDPNAVEFFSKPACGGPRCQSFPSGHAANAVVWYGVAFLLIGQVLPRLARAAIRTITPLVVAAATVIAQHHWVSDTIAGLLAGIGIYLVVTWTWRPSPGDTPARRPLARSDLAQV